MLAQMAPHLQRANLFNPLNTDINQHIKVMRGLYIREINLPVLIEVYAIRKSGAKPQIYIYYIRAISVYQTILHKCNLI